MNPASLNLPFLEFLVKTKIDSIRNELGLPPLVNDSILYVAAKHHADYLIKNKILSHNERPGKFTNPQKRAESFGAVDYFVGENVASTFILIPVKSKWKKKPHINETYDQAAMELATAWLKSKPHFKNIKNKKYQITGLALQYDRGKNNIKAVQKFADVKSKFVFTENTNFFIYEEPFTIDYKLERFDQVSTREHTGRHVWGIKKPKKNFSKCRECNAVYNASTLGFFLDSSTGTIGATIYSRSQIKRIAKRRKDGFAVEVVEYTPYECGNKEYFLQPSRRNGQCVGNGKIQKPVYKWKLRHGLRVARRISSLMKTREILQKLIEFKFRTCYPTIPSVPFRKEKFAPSVWKLGKLPKNNDSTYYEINIILLRRKRQCGVIHFTDFCGAPFEQITPLTLLSDLTEKPFIYPEDTLTHDFVIPFEKNKFDYKIEDIRPLLDTLSLSAYRIINIDVSAFASVEGNIENNKTLAEKRVKSIVSSLQSAQKDSLTQKIIFEEDWKQFYQQLSKTEFAEWRKLSKDEIKEKLEEDSLSLKLEPILTKQRRAEISIKVMRIADPDEQIAAAKNQYQCLMDSATHFKSVSGKILEKLLVIQTYLYQQVLAGRVDTSWLFSVPIPFAAPFGRLLTNHFYFKMRFLFTNDSIPDEKELYQSLKEISLYKGARSVAKYNHMAFLLNKWRKEQVYDPDTLMRPAKILKHIKSIRPSEINSDSISLLLLNYYFKASEWSLNNGNDSLREICVKGVFNYYKRKRMNDSIAYKVARFLIYHGDNRKAYNLLKPYALKQNPNHELLVLFLKMSFIHGADDPKSKFIKWMANGANILNEAEYCSMFTGPCNMSFQVFDIESIRKTYCEKCTDKLNYAQEYRNRKRLEKDKK